MKRRIIYIGFILGLLLYSNYVEARKVSGFIITENSDTIYGEIKVSSFNLLTAGLVLDGINLEPLYFEVWFRDYGNRRFDNFLAKDISGFGFNCRDKDYTFHSFTLESNSFFKSEKKRERFLQLCYTGEVYIYKYLSRIKNHDDYTNNTHTVNYNQTFIYYDYFLFNKTKGLTKVEISKDIKTINGLLSLYEFDPIFIELIPKNTKLKDIKVVLKKYELWLYKNQPKTINI